MESMEACAPKDYLALLKEHSEVDNIPRIGNDRNVVAPAQQINTCVRGHCKHGRDESYLLQWK